MKTILAILASCTLSANAAGVFHEFTATDGRKLKAKVISYDGSVGKVKIKRDDGAVVRVKIGAFIREDQAYIQQWEAVSLFMSETEVPVTLSRIEERKWKKTRESMRNGGMGGMGGMGGGNSGPSGPRGPGGGGGEGGGGQDDSNGGGPGGQGADVVATDKFARYHYQIKLSNRSEVELDNLTVNYRIFYDQDRAVPDEGVGIADTSRNSGGRGNDVSAEFYHAESQRLEASGKVDVDKLPPKSRKMVPTVGVTILNRNAKSDAEGDMIDLEGELKGIWVKVSMTAPDGTVRTRDIALPKRIARAYEWNTRKPAKK
ncbi:hypothetical protein P4B35_15135 [Pontiellaceae bacterium B12227]|nr:hypothetical protein [Pontiellaceae bacterium B12227]